METIIIQATPFWFGFAIGSLVTSVVDFCIVYAMVVFANKQKAKKATFAENERTI